MNLILDPILTKIDNMKISIKLPEGIKYVKAKLLLGVFDLPAKAMAVQFNGKYGYSLDKSTHLNYRMLYLPGDSHEPRQESDLAEDAEKQRDPIFGVKGTSVLSPYINMLKAVPVDYMHAVLEGVTKSLLTYWFDSKYHGKPFYLGRQVKEVDKFLLRIKPPHEFRKSVRTLNQYGL